MKLFSNKIEPRCDYCEKKDTCVKKGNVCRKYKYNPLERIPFKNAKMPNFNKDDFKL